MLSYGTVNLVFIIFVVLYFPRIWCWFASFKKQDRLFNYNKNKLALIIPARNEGRAVLPLFESIEIQTYDRSFFDIFVVVKEYNDPPVSITDETIILIEGLHAINDKMTPDLDPSKKFKIFLSPLMPLNIDKHNYISINDLRLMRRIVRDNRTRATDVGQTISYWNIVRNGEEKNIYPFVNGVDRVLNTSLAYEVGVLKVFVLPLLYSVTEESLAYTEARRIIESLDEFYPIPSDYVPDDSILREFIGKSIFESYK